MTNVLWTNVIVTVGISSRFYISSVTAEIFITLNWEVGVVCIVKFGSNTTFVKLGWVELCVRWGFDSIFCKFGLRYVIKRNLCYFWPFPSLPNLGVNFPLILFIISKMTDIKLFAFALVKMFLNWLFLKYSSRNRGILSYHPF